MYKLNKINLKKCFDSEQSKLIHNKNLFALVSKKYNKATRLLSLGQDQFWKNELINFLPNINKPICLDIACGTGDITFRLADKYIGNIIYGLDISNDMIVQANNLNKYENINFVNADMCNSSFEDHFFDIITCGYALRNSPNLKKTLEEIKRILKPNGAVGILDFSKFNNSLLQKLQYQVLKFWGIVWGLILHKNHTIYSYIAESLKNYPSSLELQKLITENGFNIIFKKTYFFGNIEIMILKSK